ncbi:MAG: type I-C CRISPR-associated protein Cas5 [Hydrococcus sp. SU_1_0]|nr:type I-C CRISPR-associated protein Cas5 [Hydrococcus sp. SU_1_0]
MSAEDFYVRVWGDYACFSRPEFKVERVSYPVMTPSAARGVLEAIFWKPEMRFEIREIRLLSSIKQTTLLRNEISKHQSNKPFFVEDARQQRASLILKDVDYLIWAKIFTRPHASKPVFKYRDCFRRRLERGQYHHKPYFGTREFPAEFEAIQDIEQFKNKTEAIDLDLGSMLFDVAFVPSENRKEMSFHRHGISGATVTKGYAEAIFFSAKLEKGILKIDSNKYRELDRLEGRDV